MLKLFDRRIAFALFFVLLSFFLSCSFTSFTARMEMSGDNFYDMLGSEKLETLTVSFETPWMFILDDKEVLSAFDDMLKDMVASYEDKRFSRNDEAAYLVLSGVEMTKDTTQTFGALTTIRDSILTRDEYSVGNFGLEEGQKFYMTFKVKQGNFLACDPGFVSEDGKSATLVFVGPNEAERIHIEYKLPTAWYKIWDPDGREEFAKRIKKLYKELADFLSRYYAKVGSFLGFGEGYIGYPVSDKDAGEGLRWVTPQKRAFGDYAPEYQGYHAGEDWALFKDDALTEEALNKPVYAVAPGIVKKISHLGFLGGMIAIEHPAPEGKFFTIPEKSFNVNGKEFHHPQEQVDKFISISMHLTPHDGIHEGVHVEKGDILGYIMDAGPGPYLYFEIRHPNAEHSKSWALVGKSSNWSYFSNNGKKIYNGYYKEPQAMIDAGVREPRSFIEANAKLASPIRPDLLVKSVNVPSSTQAGEKITVKVEIKNQGADLSFPRFFLRIVLSTDKNASADDIEIASESIKAPFWSVLKKFSQEIEVRIPNETPEGEYFIGAYIDDLSTCYAPSFSSSIKIKGYETWTFAHITDVHIGWKDDKLWLASSILENSLLPFSSLHDYYFDKEYQKINIAEIPQGAIYFLYGVRFCDALMDIADTTKHNPNPEFILITGDLVEWAKKEYFSQFKAYIDTFEEMTGIHSYIVPGNHDRYMMPPEWNSLVQLPPLVSKITGWGNDKLKLYKEFIHQNPSYNRYEHKGVLFIGLDTGADFLEDFEVTDWPRWPGGGDLGPEGNGLTSGQLGRLKEEDKNIRKVIFMHHPAKTNAKDLIERRQPMRKEIEDASFYSNYDRFIDYCDSNNVNLVLSGHTHMDKMFYGHLDEKKCYENNTWFVQTPSATKDGGSKYHLGVEILSPNYKHGYRLISVDAKEIKPLPYTKTPTPRDPDPIKRNILIEQGNAKIYTYDSQNQKTGAGSIITDIPNSFYTGFYGASTPQAIILYNTDEPYRYTIDGVGKDTVMTSLFSHDLHVHIPRMAVTKSTLDEMRLLSDTTFTYKTSDPSKPFSLSISKTVKDEFRRFVISNTTISNQDSTSFKVVGEEAVKYVNVGAPKSYDFEFFKLGAETTRVAYANLRIGDNETHIIKPTSWEKLGASDVGIEIDRGNDGSIDSTMTVTPSFANNRISDVIPAAMAIRPVYTLPISTQAVIQYDIPVAGETKIAVFDTSCRRVRTLEKLKLAPGSYAKLWDGKDETGKELPAGVYFVRMQLKNETGVESKTVKIILLH